jgi:hypothetical protein
VIVWLAGLARGGVRLGYIWEWPQKDMTSPSLQRPFPFYASDDTRALVSGQFRGGIRGERAIRPTWTIPALCALSTKSDCPRTETTTVEPSQVHTRPIPRPLLRWQRQSEQPSRTSSTVCWPKHGCERPRSR